jgi:hypothetical protein
MLAFVTATARLSSVALEARPQDHDHGAAQQPAAAMPDMMKMHMQMMAEIKADGAKLDAPIKEMNTAIGPARTDAVVAVVNELVRQHKGMQAHIGAMHEMMMAGGGIMKH